MYIYITSLHNICMYIYIYIQYKTPVCDSCSLGGSCKSEDKFTTNYKRIRKSKV